MTSKYHLEIFREISSIKAQDWNRCAEGRPVENHKEMRNPFLSHAFLNTLEITGCASEETGWAPHHLVLKNQDEKPVGIMPGYFKSHSQGEYVFDFSWAHAYEQAGGRYYPKYLCGVPFTPVTGRRLLIDHTDSQNSEHIAHLLLQGALKLTHSAPLSSFHINFLTHDEWHQFGNSPFLQRQDQQFHWENAGYACFETFLETLASRKRKAIRKERKQALVKDISIEWITGETIQEEHWEAFYQFYQDTGSRKWGTPYLSLPFFKKIGACMPENILLVMARREGKYIAGALNMIGTDTLFGRYWGAIEHHRCLHFEVCYYQAIDFAIQHGLKRVEAGAQGSHKLARGYMPSLTYSLHYIADPGFRDVLERYLQDEREAVEDERTCLTRQSPFRKES